MDKESRKIEDLYEPMQKLARAHQKACEEAGITLLIYCTLRPNSVQDALYAQGRTKKGRIVTNARAGQSAHNYGLAYDCVPLVGGKPVWNQKTPEEVALWNKVGKLGEQAGLEWAGRWTGSLRETAHFQYPNWKETAKTISSVGSQK